MQFLFGGFCQRFYADSQPANLAAAKRFQRALRIVPLDSVRLLQQLRAGASQNLNVHGDSLQNTRIRG
ncbi:hypothetical protein D3C86_1561270 [compost metagenome]